MAAPRGGATKPAPKPTRGGVECVWPAMEASEVGVTRDAITIIGEMCGMRHEGTTEETKEATEKLKGGRRDDGKIKSGDGEINRDEDAGNKRHNRHTGRN